MCGWDGLEGRQALTVVLQATLLSLSVPGHCPTSVCLAQRGSWCSHWRRAVPRCAVRQVPVETEESKKEEVPAEPAEEEKKEGKAEETKKGDEIEVEGGWAHG